MIRKMNFDDDVKKIFFETFPFLNESDFDWEKTQNNYEDWDSFAQLNLITLTEAKFEITFSDDEITSINSAKALLDIIKSKISCAILVGIIDPIPPFSIIIDKTYFLLFFNSKKPANQA